MSHENLVDVSNKTVNIKNVGNLSQETLKYNPLTQCVQIATEATGIIMFGSPSFTDNKKIKTKNTYVSSLYAAGIATDIAIDISTRTMQYIMKRTGHQDVSIDLDNLNGINKGGLELILEGKNGNHLISVKEISKKRKVIYAVNVEKDKAGIIEGEIGIEELLSGVYLEDNGNLRVAKETNDATRIFKYEGLALASKEMIKENNLITVKQVQDVFEISNEKAEEMGTAGIKILMSVVKGITSPNKQSMEVRAIAGLLGETSASDIKAENLYQLFEISKGTDRKEIMNAILSRMEMLSRQGTGAEVELSIELTAVAGGLLLAMENQKVDSVRDLNQTKITGNQKTITRLLKTQYRDNYAKVGNDFIIDISNLQKAFKEKATYTVEERRNILDALASDSSRWQEEEKVIVGLFKLQNIQAIAASA